MKTTKRILTFTLALALLLSCLAGFLPLQAQAAEPRLGLREIFPLSFENMFLVGNGFIIYSSTAPLSNSLQPLAPGEEHIVCDFDGNELFRTSEYILRPLADTPYIYALHMKESDEGLPPVLQSGVLNLQGEVIIPVEHYDVRPAREGFVICLPNPSGTGLDNAILVGLVNETGEVIYEPQYATSIYFDPLDRDCFNGQKDGVWHNVQLSNGEILYTFDPKLDAMRSITIPEFNPEYPWLRASKGESWGIVDYDGNVLLPFEYEVIKSFSDNLCWVKKDGLWGLVDSEFNIVLPPTLDLTADMDWAAMWFDFQQGYAPVQNTEGLWGLINSKGDMVVDFGYYEEMSTPKNTMQEFRPVGVKKDGLWGLIGSEGELLTEIEYRHVMWFANDRGFVCTTDGNWLLLDGTGSIITEQPFDFNDSVTSIPEEQPDGTIVHKDWVMHKIFESAVLDVPFRDSYGLIDRDANYLAQGFDWIDTYFVKYPYVAMQNDGLWGLWEVVQLAADVEPVVMMPQEKAAILETPTVQDPAQDPATATTSELPILIEIAGGRVSKGEELLPEMPAMPQIVEGRTLLPFRYLIENLLGGSVDYDADNEAISAEVDGVSYSMKTGDYLISINDVEHNFGAAPMRSGDTVLIPLRAFEGVVTKITWDAEVGVVSIMP